MAQEFEVRQAGEAGGAEDDPNEGLVAYRQTGDSEFWLHFENGTKLGVEQVALKRNPYKQIRIDPAPPTAEEIAAKAALVTQLREATAKAAKAGKPPPTDIVIPETPRPTYEQKELNHLDELFTDDMVGQTQSMATVTLANGLIVQYMGNGRVTQIHEAQAVGDAKGDSNCEVNRLVTKEGIVLRQMRNRDAEVLYPNGQKALFSKKNMEWVVTNNKGRRRAYRDAVLVDLEAIPCATETDAVSGAKMMIREDDVCTVQYTDGSLFTQHSDGTQVHTSADGTEVRIEKTGYATHVIRTGQKELQQQSAKANVFSRALDDCVLETYLPDGSVSQSYLDSVQTKKRGEVQKHRHVFKRADLSVVVVDGEGHISVISSNARAALNEAGGKVKLDYAEKDTDWLAELARSSGQFVPSVYQAYVSAKENRSTIKTKNSQDNTVFVLKNDHTLSKRVADVPQPEASPKQQRRGREEKKAGEKKREAQRQMVGDMELEQTGVHQDPHTKYFTYPRFFVV